LGLVSGKSSRVWCPSHIQSQLEDKLAQGSLPQAAEPQVVMIQCVDSRNEKNPYCSRVCCSEAVKNALELKRQKPNTRVVVLYRDIRTYGFREVYYQKAREAGVLFVRPDYGASHMFRSAAEGHSEEVNVGLP
jgi:heterodisulfide reductase subunit A